MSGVGGNYTGEYGGFDQHSALSFARFQREEEFKIESEDFPALGATPKTGTGNELQMKSHVDVFYI